MTRRRGNFFTDGLLPILRRRPLLPLPESGGPAAGGAALKFTVEPRWLNPAARRIECTADGVPMPAPVADANGDFRGPVASFTQTTLDGLVMANLGLDRLISVGGQTQGRVIMDLVSSGMINPGDIAMALPSLTKPTLIFTARFPGMRHAASDPSVVLHELAHLVLSRGVGGTQLARPFEGAGESGAAMEGLADFLGLTLWNAIRRSSLGTPDIETLGQFVLGTSGRDYSAMIASPATAPTLRSATPPRCTATGWCCASPSGSRASTSCRNSPSPPTPRIGDVEGGVRQFAPDAASGQMSAILLRVPRAARDHRAQFEPALTRALAARNIPSNCPHTRSH